MEDNKKYVAAFNQQGAWPKTSQPTAQNSRRYQTNRVGQQSSGFNQRGGGNNSNNSNRKNKYCYFCKLQGHQQEECRERIKENKPCRDSQGRTYWPIIYLMDENQDAKSINSIHYPENEKLDDDDNSFDIARDKFRD
jgi:hypothetical protein